MISQFLVGKTKTKRKRIKDDPQRHRVYGMERDLLGNAIYHRVRQKDLQVIADHACRYYRVPRIFVRLFNQPNNRRFGESVYHEDNETKEKSGFYIRLNRGFHGANTHTLLHELAHYIADVRVHRARQSHGPQFVGIYMHLMDKYRVLPEPCFRVLARKYGVRIARKFRPEDLTVPE